MRGDHPRLVACLLVLCALLIVLPATALAQPDVPAQFEATPVTDDVERPTALAIVPESGGDLLITSQQGELYLLEAGSQNATSIFDVSDRFGDCNANEQGLLGVAVHPDFPNPGGDWVYLYYTAEDQDQDRCVNRVSRFPFDGSTVTDAENPLLENMRSTNGNHNGGDLQFGKDGNLYVSIGEAGVPRNAQKKNLLSGKILRIAADGQIPDDNPFNGVSCADEGQTAANQTCGEIFALGLRNPFRIAFDPNVSGTKFYINDVGQQTWEEIDRGKAGANYGWPEREGPCKQGKTGKQDCKRGPKKFTKPIYAYRHKSGCKTITGGAFVPNASTNEWPPAFKGKYLFAEFGCDKIFRLDKKKKGFERTLFVNNADGVTHMTMSPDGVLYFTTIAGEVRSITPTP